MVSTTTLFAVLVVLVASAVDAKKKFYYETRYSEEHKQSTTVLVQKQVDIEDFSVSCFASFDDDEGVRTLYSHYHKDGGTHAVLVDRKAQTIYVVVKKTSKSVTVNLEKKKWHHIAVTRKHDSGDTTLYVNGKQVKVFSNFESDYRVRKEGSFVLAQYQTDTRKYEESHRHVGRLTETYVYSEVLTSDKVTKLSKKEELSSSEAKTVYSWESSYAHDGMTTVSESSLRTEECSVKSDSEEKDSDENKTHSDEDDHSSEEDSQTSYCSSSYDLYFTEEATGAVAAPRKASVNKDLTQVTISSYSYTEDVSQESTVLSYATDDDDDTIHIGQKNGMILVRIGKKTYQATEQKEKIKSKEWHHSAAVWRSETGEVHVYHNGKKVQVIRDVKKGKTIRKGGSIVVGQRQTKRNTYDKETRHVGRVTRTHIDSSAFSDEQITKVSSKTRYYKATKTTVVSSRSSYEYTGLSQVRETTLRSEHSSGEKKDDGENEDGGENNDGGDNDGGEHNDGGENNDGGQKKHTGSGEKKQSGEKKGSKEHDGEKKKGSKEHEHDD